MYPNASEFEALLEKYLEKEADEFRPRPQLSGTRMAWVSEPDNTFFNGAALKALTGGDALLALGIGPNPAFIDVFRQQILRDAFQ